MVGVTNGKDCCVICASNRRLSGLQDLTMIDKVSELRPGVFMAFAGLAADGRVLVHQARDFVGRFRMDHAEDASIQDIALAIAGTYIHYTHNIRIGRDSDCVGLTGVAAVVVHGSGWWWWS